MSIVELFQKVMKGKLSAKQAAVRMHYDNLCHISELVEANRQIDELKEKNDLYLSILCELEELITQHSVDVHDPHPRMSELSRRCKIQEEATTNLYRAAETLLRNVKDDMEEYEK